MKKILMILTSHSAMEDTNSARAGFAAQSTLITEHELSLAIIPHDIETLSSVWP